VAALDVKNWTDAIIKYFAVAEGDVIDRLSESIKYAVLATPGELNDTSKLVP
jgi:hypothetical protein